MHSNILVCNELCRDVGENPSTETIFMQYNVVVFVHGEIKLYCIIIEWAKSPQVMVCEYTNRILESIKPINLQHNLFVCSCTIRWKTSVDCILHICIKPNTRSCKLKAIEECIVLHKWKQILCRNNNSWFFKILRHTHTRYFISSLIYWCNKFYEQSQ